MLCVGSMTSKGILDGASLVCKDADSFEVTQSSTGTGASGASIDSAYVCLASCTIDVTDRPYWL